MKLKKIKQEIQSEVQSKFVEDSFHLDGSTSRFKQDANSINNYAPYKNQRPDSNKFTMQNCQNKQRPSSSFSRGPNTFNGDNQRSFRQKSQSQVRDEGSSGGNYSKCGQIHRVKCPAEGKTCRKCKKVGHFAKFCRSDPSKGQSGLVRQVQPDKHPSPYITEDQDHGYPDDSQTSWAVRGICAGETPRAKVTIGETEVTMCVDTSASTTIINEAHYLKLVPKPELLTSTSPVYGFSASKPIEIIGEFEARLIVGNKSSVSTVSVVKGNCRCLFSCSDCVSLDLKCQICESA